MTSELEAAFRKEFRGCACIRANLLRPASGFSITVLFGPSGSGKTTVLRCLAGLERPEHGHIRFGDELWFHAEKNVSRSPQQRDIGFLFQDYALFPHLSVAGNVAYGLHGSPATTRRQRVVEILDRFGLTGLEHRQLRQISGGQQQRVALARTLARRPRLLLLDEPLSALDAHLREQLRGQLRGLLAEFGVPVFVVTHDRAEAIALGDHVVVLDGGTILQQGKVHEVFTRPANREVAQIVGMETVEFGKIVSVQDGLATVRVGKADLVAVAPGQTEGEGEVCVCIRGEEVILQQEPGGLSSVRNRLKGHVSSLTPEGPLVRVIIDCGFLLTAFVTRSACEELALQPGAGVTALIKAPSIHVIARGT